VFLFDLRIGKFRVGGEKIKIVDHDCVDAFQEVIFTNGKCWKIVFSTKTNLQSNGF